MIHRTTAKLLFFLTCCAVITPRQARAVDPLIMIVGGSTLAGIVVAWLWTDEHEHPRTKQKKLFFGGLIGAAISGLIISCNDKPSEEILDNAQAALDASLSTHFEKYPTGTNVPAATAAELLKRSIAKNQHDYRNLLRHRELLVAARKKTFFNEKLSSLERSALDKRYENLIKRFDERSEQYHNYLVKLQVAQTKLHAELHPLGNNRPVSLPALIKVPASPDQLHIKIL